MGRYTGPRSKKSRRLGVAVFGPDKAFERRSYPPGVHGERGRRKQTDYGLALAEKQKLRLTYLVGERQFRRYFEMARKRRGVTGEALLGLLETRLDNVVYRLGLAITRFMARQMVVHGHIAVNGRKVTIPSHPLRPGDVVEVRNRPQSRKLALRNLELTQIARVPEWLSLDREALRGEVRRIPSREEIQSVANEQLVVELYSK
ncbi:30S ribosomal protein S4 [Candidatus Methylacidithermus pantelleriae]|uniref:Small ribosomal subunit protein uS4 n=1 Tax=Candidatus Methylacidithermus pantelleriae TaxID=2744239 RepID=A0A8J2FS03_9BACT|nr:30S ribosomal protein S4 [Candidatus Methylacidithermus pantelleriae]CAF0695427.1 30S ribosomal subunit protein S4 [Candidatus Methylacidithermus pantelleriae]